MTSVAFRSKLPNKIEAPVDLSSIRGRDSPRSRAELRLRAKRVTITSRFACLHLSLDSRRSYDGTGDDEQLESLA